MLAKLFLWLSAGLTAIAVDGSAFAKSSRTYEFQNGRWFDGEKFVHREVYSEWGLLRYSRPDRVDVAVDLQGGYVLPPFCEAHNHNLGSDFELDDQLNKYLKDGIFYVKVLSNLPRETAPVWHRFNRPDSVDVQFANGGITGPGGHPIALRERILSFGAYEGFTKESLKNHAYYVINSRQDLEDKWKLILQYRPDFLKLFLLNSQLHKEQVGKKEYFGKTGLDPDIFPAIVDKAHEYDLRVSVHIESDEDFRLAVKAGADEIAHLPGRRDINVLTKSDAAEAVKQNTVIVTTASLLNRLKDEQKELFLRLQAQQKKNLRVLHEAGVILAIGSDAYEETSSYEADYLHSLSIFSNKELLRMWTENCAKTVFPNRNVGRVEEGYEATFIVLKNNPLKDWAATKGVVYRFKDGRPLRSLNTPPARRSRYINRH